MDFALTEELKMVKKNVREFTERELFPLEQEFCLSGHLPLDKRLDLERRGREIGFWALDVPVADGGAGLGQLAMCVIHEDRKSTRLNSSHIQKSRMPSSA